MDTGEALFQSKENIQPLTHGRITSHFGTALHAQSNAEVQQELNKKVDEFELQLVSYDGDDELAIWVEYLSWIEQSFPKGGKEGNLRLVLEKCLTKFKDAICYMQDQRLVKLWIKYIDLLTDKNSKEMYSMVHGHGIGTESALFYQFWAYEYEKCSNFKKADEIYLLGIQHRAQPEEALLQAHRQFQLAVAQMTLYGTMPPPRRPDIPEREAMSRLQSHGSKNQVPSVRTGSLVMRSAPLTNANIVSTPANNVNQGTIKIFMDKEESSLITTHQRLHSLPHPQVTNKENRFEAGPWTGSSVSNRKQRNHSVPSSKPAQFQVHTDEFADAISNGRMSNVNALQSIKIPGYEYHSVFESDPTKRVMYPKEQVYCGGREYSLEELRARKYPKKKASPQLQASAKDDRGDCNSTLEVSKQTSVPNEHFNKDVIASVEPIHLLDLTKTCHSTVRESEDGSNGGSSNMAVSQRKSTSVSTVQAQLEQLSIARSCDITDKEFASATLANKNGESLKREYISFVNESKNINETDQGCIASPVQILKLPKMDYQRPSPYLEGSFKFGDNRSMETVHSDAASIEENGSRCKNDSASNNEPSLLHSQSMTVNTKEAMAFMMNEMWGSNVALGSTQKVQHANSTVAGTISPPVAAIEELPQVVEASFVIFTDEDENVAPVPQSRHVLLTTDATIERANLQKRSRPTFYFGDEDIEENQNNKENAPMEILKSYEDEEILPVGIPAVASPGMTEDELRAMEGTEAKENDPPRDYVVEKPEHRPLEGILQPSRNIPYISVQEPQDNEFDNMTCSTQAFNFPLMASTPFHSNTVRHTDQSTSLTDKLTSVNEESEQIKVVSRVDNLSTIMENSKEFKSSSSSGSSNGGTTTRRSTFSQSSATAELRQVSVTSVKKQQTSECGQASYRSLTKQVHCFETKEETFVHAEPKQGCIAQEGEVSVERGEGAKVQEDYQESFVEQNQLEDLFTADVFSSPVAKRVDAFRFSVPQFKAKEEIPTKVPEKLFRGGVTYRLASCDIDDTDIASEDHDQDLVEEHAKSVDPFDKTLIEGLLEKICFPRNRSVSNYFECESDLSSLKRGSVATLGDTVVTVESSLGKGAYAQVFKVVEKGSNLCKALKVQKPSWAWEIYIVNEIHARLESHHRREAFMEVEKCVVSPNSSAILYEYSKYGTLLTAINKLKTDWIGKKIEVLAMVWAVEMLEIVEELHACRIIHGDLKPDNFVLRELPLPGCSSLQLIDFGRAIDMYLLPAGTTFNVAVETDSFQCPEMRSGRPWTYQTDLYGVAASIHCVLFGDYMQVAQVKGRWGIKASFPRYIKYEVWESFFGQLLNVESCNKMPDLGSIRQQFKKELKEMSQTAYSYFGNLMENR